MRTRLTMIWASAGIATLAILNGEASAMQVKSFRECHKYAEELLDKYHLSKGDPAVFDKLRAGVHHVMELCADNKFAEASAAIVELEKIVEAEVKPVPGKVGRNAAKHAGTPTPFGEANKGTTSQPKKP